MQMMKGKRANRLARAVAGACVFLGVAGAAQAALQLEFQTIGGGFIGDGGQANKTLLTGIENVVFDSAGNLYLTQAQGNRIRKITPAGVISTIVGGVNGYGGDGGPASSARINRPSGLAIDGAGNLYFVDTGNRRVRKITPAGTISTIAGNGMALVAGDGGPATQASFQDPYDVAVDKNGNVFVVDRLGNTVRKITAAGTISTYAGGGEQDTLFQGQATQVRLNNPYSIAVDARGVLYIADTNNRLIRRVVTNGYLTNFVPDDGNYRYPYSVDVDRNGNVYVGSNSCDLLKYNSEGVLQIGWSGQANYCQRTPEGSPANGSGMGFVGGVAVDGAGNIFYADLDFERVARIDTAGKLWTHAGGVRDFADGTVATAAPMGTMSNVTVTDNGTVIVADHSTHRIRSISGGKAYTIAGDGKTFAFCEVDCGNALNWNFQIVSGLASAAGNTIYVNDRTQGVHLVTPDKTVAQVFNVDKSTANARGIATDLGGNMFIADYANNRIRKRDTAGVFSTVAGTGIALDPPGDGGPAILASLYRPNSIALDAGGSVYFWELTNAMRKVGRDGKIRRIAGNGESGPYSGDGGLALNARLGSVTGMTVHPTGVYFTSEGKIRRVRPDARIETLDFPYYAWGLSVKYGYLYVTTQNGYVMRALLPRAVATADYDGDGKSDVLFRGAAGANLVWLGANSTTKQSIATMSTENKLVGQGDFDGDGEVDLVWRNTVTGANTIWRSGNANTQMVIASVADQNWTIAGVGDFNGDGKADLFWRNRVTGANEYWPHAVAGSKKAVTAMADLHWVVAGFGDFDGDGRSDVLWRNTQTGANQAWPGLLASQGLQIDSVTNTNWKVAAIGDFNGDGASDIVWRDGTTGASAIWRSGNSAWRQSIVGVTNTQWSIAAAADYGNDGIDDLLWRNNVTGENVIWKNAANAKQQAVASAGNAWKVQPVNAQP